MVQNMMWGERGLVATLFNSLADDVSLARWRTFLSRLSFAGGSRPVDWDSLADARSIVEPSFGTRGFGSPDCVAKLVMRGKAPFGVIFEAKTSRYEDSALHANQRGQQGFNSSINGQLELNHRLSVVLASHQDREELREASWVSDSPYASAGAPRYVLNENVIRNVASKLHGLPMQNYLHIAITGDADNPFEQRDSIVPQIFGDASGKDHWEDARHRFGWIGWGEIHRLATDWSATRFLESYELNRHYVEQSDSRRTLRQNRLNLPVEDGRPYRGISVVHLPDFSSDTVKTAVHLSWVGNSCRVRNYVDPGSKTNPGHPNSVRLTDVLPLIRRERRMAQGYPAVTRRNAWTQIMEQVNRAWGFV